MPGSTDTLADPPRLSALIEHISDFVAVLDETGTVLYASASVTTIGGYTPEQLLGRRFTEFLHPQDLPKALAVLEEVLRDGGRAHACECRFRDIRGNWHVLNALARDRRAEPGVHGIVVTARDMTDLRRAEEQHAHAQDLLRQSLLDSVRALAAAVEARDGYTAGHQQRVAALSVAIAHRMGFDAEREHGLMLAASIHDIGKLRVPIEILTKPGRLTELEYALVQTHVDAAGDIVGRIAFPWPIATIIAQHHERMDGSGYPRHLKGDRILLEARIIAVADTVESMTNQRPYRRGQGIDMALAEIERGRGSVYDADVADTCLRLFNDDGYSIADG